MRCTPCLVVLIAGSMLVAACGSNEVADRGTTEPPAAVSAELDASGLVDLLVIGGATVEPAGTFTGVALTGSPQLIRVNGVDVQLYEYADAAAAATEAAYVSPDAGTISVGNAAYAPGWIGTPHFYLAGRLIVQYIGDDATVITLFESLLGPQFAGGLADVQPRLVVEHRDPPEGAPMTFEEAAVQAGSVVLAEVTSVEAGPPYVASLEPSLCRPSQLVTLEVLEVYKGSLVVGGTATLYQTAGVTDMASGCGDDASAEVIVLIGEDDPLYEANQRYLLALGPLIDSLDPDPAITEANPELTRLIEQLEPRQVLRNGRLLVEQGGHRFLADSDVLHTAYDSLGRTIPGTPTGRSLADYQMVLADLLS